MDPIRAKTEITARNLRDIPLGELLDAVSEEPFFQQAFGALPKVRKRKRRLWVPPEDRAPVILHHPTRKSVGYFGAVRLRGSDLTSLARRLRTGKARRPIL